jgi:ADP-ribose pyrophosphatase YjhB (NUDIX family)
MNWIKINKFHLGIYGIILKNSSILLIKKSRGPYKGKLDLPGGKPEHGESPRQTLVREILEETGIISHEDRLFNNYSTVAEQIVDDTQEITHHLGMIYLILSYDGNALISEMDSEDSLGAQWYHMADLNENMLSPFAARAIKDIKQLS